MAANGDVVVAGVRSPYSEVGDHGDREAVVFVHGNPGPASDWSGLLDCVGEFARGIAMDFPGYGNADRPRHFDYSVGGYARHLDGALAELGEVVMAATTQLGAKAVLRRENPGLRGTALNTVARAIVRSSSRAVLGLYRATPAEALAAPARALAALDRPALVIWGEAEAYLPLEQAELQRQAFPSARIVTLPGTGHWAMHERPADVRDIVIPFLREQIIR